MPWPTALEPLTRRMTVAMSALLFAVILGMLWLSHARVVDALTDSELARLKSSADRLSTTLHDQGRRLLADASKLAASPAIRDAALGSRSRTAAALLDTVKARSTQIRSVSIWNAKGELLMASGPTQAGDRPDGSLRLETATSPVISRLKPVGDTVTYSVTAPIGDLTGKPIGYVLVTRQFPTGAENARLMAGLVGPDARVLIGNAGGDFVSDMNRRVAADTSRPEPGRTKVYPDPTGKALFSAAALVTETPWVVFVEAPRALALRAATRFTLESGVFGIAFVLAGALVSWLLIRRTMQPLQDVTSAAQGIAAGDMTRRVSVSGNDEIGILGDAFNQMIARVERSSADLATRAGQLEVINKDLNESEARYRGLFEHLPDGILVHRDRKILFANPSAVRILGARDQSDLVDHNILDFVLANDRDLVRERIEHITNNHTVPTVEVRMQRVDRKIVTVEGTSMPLAVDGTIAVQTILHDVTERRLLEEQFRHSQKMDAVGRLAGGVAHDFNNLLTVIQAHAEFALAEAESPESRRADIEEIRKTADSAARLTRQLLTFSRKQSLTPASIDLNDAIDGMLGMIRRLIGDNIEVVAVKGEALECIWADPGQIQQVLLNLAVNARDAMPEGGVLRLETANIRVGEGYVGAATSVIPPGEYVMLAVHDTGIGMTEEIRSRVFEPFFTTKVPGRGTGLGLSTVYGIVKQSQGHIWVYSEPGMGTAFKVLFPPYRDGIVSQPEGVPSEDRGTVETGHLLVVEDDASVRAAVVRALRAVGYTVTEAPHAAEALDVIGRDPSIELMITDMMMPGMPGITLLNEVRLLRPGLPAIVLSGYAEPTTSEFWSVPDHAVFVEKPVSPAEIIRRVKQLLAPH